MKQLIILLAIFVNINSLFQKKETYCEATYTVSLNKDLAENTRDKKLRYLLKNAQDMKFLLVFDSKNSQYNKIKSMQNDSHSTINITEIEAGGNNMYYYDKINKINTYSKNLSADSYLISRKALNWKLTKDYKKIGDYNCYKAIALNSENKETNIIAWYTPDIPLPYGPKHFNNLPGLIIKLNTGKTTYQITKITFTDKELTIQKPNQGIRLTYEEFKKRFSNFFKNK